MYLGDYVLAATIYHKFTTRGTTGLPTTLAGSPALSVYKTNSTTESTSGITLTVDFDGRTGLNNVAIDLASDGTFYATGCDFAIVITTGTVGGTSVVSETIATFSINNRSALRPATAGRTLVVDAAGLADANTVKVGPTGSGTAQTARDLGANLDAAVTSRMATYVQPTGFLAATFPGGTIANTTNITAGTLTTVTNLTNLPAITTGWITAAGIADGAIDAATFAASALDAVWSTATRTITGGTIGIYTGNTPQSGDAYAIVNNVTTGNVSIYTLLNSVGGLIDTEVATIVTQTTAAAIRTGLGMASANLDTQLSGIPAAVLAATVDGITVSKAIEVLVSVLSGVAVPSGSTVAFKRRDGSTTSITITYGSTDGERTASAIS